MCIRETTEYQPNGQHNATAALWLTLHSDALEFLPRAVMCVHVSHDLIHGGEHPGGIEPLEIRAKRPQQVVGGKPLRSLSSVVDHEGGIKVHTGRIHAGVGWVVLPYKSLQPSPRCWVTPANANHPIRATHWLRIVAIPQEVPTGAACHREQCGHKGAHLCHELLTHAPCGYSWLHRYSSCKLPGINGTEYMYWSSTCVNTDVCSDGEACRRGTCTGVSAEDVTPCEAWSDRRLPHELQRLCLLHLALLPVVDAVNDVCVETHQRRLSRENRRRAEWITLKAEGVSDATPCCNPWPCTAIPGTHTLAPLRRCSK